MSTGNCDDITHLLNNSHNGIARSLPESLINFEDRPSWPTALLPSSWLIYLKTVSSDMHSKSNSLVGRILAWINRIPSCDLCFSMASRNIKSSTPSGTPSSEEKYLLNTSATSCDCESIQLSSLRIILFPQLLEIFSERNGFIVFKNFLLPFCLWHRCRKYVLIDFLCNFTTLSRHFIYIALYCLLLLSLKCFPLHIFRWKKAVGMLYSIYVSSNGWHKPESIVRRNLSKLLLSVIARQFASWPSLPDNYLLFVCV